MQVSGQSSGHLDTPFRNTSRCGQLSMIKSKAGHIAAVAAIQAGFVAWSFSLFYSSNVNNGEGIDHIRYFVAFIAVSAIFTVVSLLIQSMLPLRLRPQVPWAIGPLVLVATSWNSLLAVVGHWGVPHDHAPLVLVLMACALGVLCWHANTNMRLGVILFLALAAVHQIGTSTITLMDNDPELSGHYPATSKAPRPEVESELIKPVSRAVRRPNIYFFLVDANARADVMRDVYKHSAAPFNSWAEERGFYVVDQSFSNYPVTAYSLASTFTMDLIVKGSDSRGTTAKLSHLMKGVSPAIDALRNRGYKIVWTSNGFQPATACSGHEDVCIHKHMSGISLQELALYRATIAPFLIEKLNSWFPQIGPPSALEETGIYYRSMQPKDIPGALARLPKDPFFWFMHFIGMHNIGMDAECRFRHPIQVVHRRPYPNASAQAYAEQAACMEDQLKTAVAAVLARDPDAVILIQADHGTSGLNGSQNPFLRQKKIGEWDADDVRELFGILNMWRLPEECRGQLYPTMSPVNNFRVLLGCIDDRKYRLVEDVSFVAAYPNWWADFPRVRKFIHGTARNYGDRPPNEAVEGVIRAVSTFNDKAAAANGKITAADVPQGWSLHKDALLPRTGGPEKVTLLVRPDMDSQLCRDVEMKANGVPYFPQDVNVVEPVWREDIDAPIDLTPFASLTGREMACVRVPEGALFFYAKVNARVSAPQPQGAARTNSPDDSGPANDPAVRRILDAVARIRGQAAGAPHDDLSGLSLPDNWLLRSDVILPTRNGPQRTVAGIVPDMNEPLCRGVQSAVTGLHTSSQEVNVVDDAWLGKTRAAIDLTVFEPLTDRDIACVRTPEGSLFLYLRILSKN